MKESCCGFHRVRWEGHGSPNGPPHRAGPGSRRETHLMKFAAASRAHDFAAGETLARAQAASAYSLFLAGGAKVSNASGSYQDLEVLPAPGVGVARFPSPSPMATGVFPGARGRRARSGRAQRSSNAGGLNEVPRVPSRGTRGRPQLPRRYRRRDRGRLACRHRPSSAGARLLSLAKQLFRFHASPRRTCRVCGSDFHHPPLLRSGRMSHHITTKGTRK
jgi:hypothetical protein